MEDDRKQSIPLPVALLRSYDRFGFNYK